MGDLHRRAQRSRRSSGNRNALERASKIPFAIAEGYLSDPSRRIENPDADFMDRVWLLRMTLVLTTASRENLIEAGVQLKTVEPAVIGLEIARKRPSEAIRKNKLALDHSSYYGNRKRARSGHVGFLEIYAKGIVIFGGQRGIYPRRATS
jgi:hypothetical protein